MKCIKLIERAAGASHRLLALGMKCADGSVNDDDCYTDFEQVGFPSFSAIFNRKMQKLPLFRAF